MTTSAKLGLELLANTAANQTLANATFAQLDQLVQAGVIDKDLTAPPGSPTNGALYIVGAAATGAWSGKSGQLAYWLASTGAWQFVVPGLGWAVRVLDELDGTGLPIVYGYTGVAWVKQAIVGTVSGDLVMQAGRTIQVPTTGVAADDVYFTSSAANANANVMVRPSGTGGAAGYIAMNKSDIANASRLQFFINALNLVFASNQTGTGTFLPMRFQAGGSTRLSIETTGVIAPGADNTQDLGTSALRFKEAFMAKVTSTDIAVSGVLTLATYTVGTMPSAAANPRGQIYVSNLASGAEPCFSDGTNWRQYSTRGIAA